MSTEENKNEVEMSHAEVTARAGGWRPKEEWEGLEEAWVDAGEFNYRGELMGRISEQSGKIHSYKDEVEELKTTVNDLKSHNEKIAENEYKRIMKQLRLRKAEAIDEGEGSTVAEIEEQMDTLKESREAAKAAPAAKPETTNIPDMNPEVQSWLVNPQNAWYNTNKVLHHTANGLAVDIAAENPDWSPGQVLAEMDTQIRKELPHKFSPSAVTGGDENKRPSGGKSSKYDPSDEEKAVGRRFVKQGVFDTIEDYYAQLDGIGD